MRSSSRKREDKGTQYYCLALSQRGNQIFPSCEQQVYFISFPKLLKARTVLKDDEGSFLLAS